MEIEARLAEVLSEFARTLGTDFPIQSILDHLVIKIVEVLPITAAGVTLISPGADPRYVAASDDAALRFEKLQTQLGQGPCVEAYQTGLAVSIPDLTEEKRFPEFIEGATAEGLRAIFTFPLRQGSTQLGALDLYRTSIGPLDVREMAAAQTLADVAAAYLLNAQARVDLQASSELAVRNSLHDDLTGLPNRALLVQRLEHAILRCRRSGRTVAILYADLDDFKAINDTYGHHVGDELLIAVANRLTSILRPGDTLARLSGDEFAILCEDLDDVAQVDPIADRIGVALSARFILSSATTNITASVGIAFAGRGDDVPEKVLQEADTAMYQVKRRGGAQHSTVNVGEHSRAMERESLERDLRHALHREELSLMYQPIVDIQAGTIHNVEALLRWNHPRLGAISPEATIGLAEDSGLITEIGYWALATACGNIADLARADAFSYGLAVNLSAFQLRDPRFPQTVAAVLTATGIAPHRLTVELTEGVFIDHSDDVLEVLRDLKRIGVLIALDDFGTGFSSLSYLKRLPVDIVKIDQGFISDLESDPTSRLIVSAVIELAHTLDMTVTAEGVENSQQHDLLKSLGCDSYQGFHFAKPMPLREVHALMNAQ